MSYLSLSLNSAQLKHTGQVVKGLYDSRYEAKFLYRLPSMLPVLVNNYWGLKAQRVCVSPRIVTTMKDRDQFQILIENGTDEKRYYLSDYFGYVESEQVLISYIQRIIKDDGISLNTAQDGSVRLTVPPNFMVTIGNKLTAALGLLQMASSSTKFFSIFLSGEYRGLPSVKDCFKAIFQDPVQTVYMATDVIRPQIFCNKLEPILCSLRPGGVEKNSQIFADIIQSPISSMSIYFLDQHGDPIYFSCPYSDSSAALFSVDLEFKKLVIFG